VTTKIEQQQHKLCRRK